MRRNERPLNSDVAIMSAEVSSPSPEFIIQADLEGVNRRGVLLPTEGRAGQGAARVEGASMVEKDIFGFPDPMVPHSIFDSASHSERGLRFAASGHEARGVCISDRGGAVVKGDAKLGVQKKAVKGDTDAARDQAVSGTDLCRIAHAAKARLQCGERLRRGTLDIEKSAFAFDSENKPAVGLPIAAQCAAADRLITETEVPGADTAGGETVQVCRFPLVSRSVADISAEVTTRPVVGRCGLESWRFDRDIGSPPCSRINDTDSREPDRGGQRQSIQPVVHAAPAPVSRMPPAGSARSKSPSVASFGMFDSEIYMRIGVITYF
jgi:hypothetical protein